jgi:hypothetical protein
MTTARVALPQFAIVGHPNKGKSSIVATLAEDDTVAIAADPGTTTRARSYPMRCDGETLYELIDTPGFQRAREVMAWLQAHDRGAGARSEVASDFLRQHAADPRFRDECELLKPILAGAGILYVVDGSRPYGPEYEPEMEVLRWTGRPRMALINLIGSGDHVASWRAALGQFFSIVRVFDAVRADFNARIELLRAFGALDEHWAAQLHRAASMLVEEREQRRQRAASRIVDLLCDVLSAVETTALQADDRFDSATQERARERLRENVRIKEQQARRAVQEIYHHAGLLAEEQAASYLTEDLFSSRSFSVFGLSAAQLALTGAASGALAGGVIDVMVGGTSLLLGSGIGAVLGAFGAIAGANTLAKVEVLGRPLGGYELRLGPITDTNFPYVILGRALLHARLVSERNHARRETLVVDAEHGQHLADTIDPERRRRLEGSFRRLRQELSLDPAQRNALRDDVASLLVGS